MIKYGLKRGIAASMLILLSCIAYAGNDKLIFRNGEIKNVKIQSINNQTVFYEDYSITPDPKQSVPLKSLYMIRFESRGNTYITPNGNRITGETDSPDKKANLVYLISGKEIPAYSLRYDNDKIIVSTKLNKKGKVKGKSGKAEFDTIPLSKVFLILYTDGVTDLINDLSLPEEKTKNTVNVTQTREEKDSVVEEPELQLITYKTKKRDTLGSIATKFDVELGQILLWNKFPKKYNKKTILKLGTPVKIYVKPIK